MRKSKIIKVAKGYVDFFQKNNNPSDYEKSEYRDFVKLHLESDSFLVDRVDNARGEKLLDHSKSVLKFLKNNNSKLNLNRFNFLSSFDDKQLLALFIPVISTLFGIGYYFGALEAKNKLNDNNDKVDLILSKSSFQTTDTNTINDVKIDDKEKKQDTLNNSDLNK